MTERFMIELDEELADALNRMIADLDPGFSRELVAVALMRDWLIAADYLPDDDIDYASQDEESPSDRYRH